jgi:hypothetical protein
MTELRSTFEFDVDSHAVGLVAVRTGMVDGLRVEALATFVLHMAHPKMPHILRMLDADDSSVIRFVLLRHNQQIWATDGRLLSSVYPASADPDTIEVIFEPVDEQKNMLSELRTIFPD